MATEHMTFHIGTRADQIDKHINDVNTLIYHKGILYSGGDDGKIIKWEEDLTKAAEVKAHPASVFCLAISGDSLYSCSNDGTIKGWMLEDLKPKGTLFTQKDKEICAMASSNGTLYSSDDEGCVRLHEGGTMADVFKVLEPLKEIIIWGNFIYTVRDLDLTITEHKPNGTYVPIEILKGRAPCCIAGDLLCYVSRDGKDIFIAENNPASKFRQLAEIKDAHRLIINALVGFKTDLVTTVLYSGGWDKMVKKWVIENGRWSCVKVLDADMVVNVLVMGERGEVYAGGSDGHIVRIDDEDEES